MYLEAQVQNITSTPLTMESVRFEPSLHYTAEDLNIEGTSRFVACCWLNISQPFKKYLTNLRSVWSSFSNKSVFWEENEKKDGLTLLKCLITYPNLLLSVLISFVVSSWIINDFENPIFESTQLVLTIVFFTFILFVFVWWLIDVLKFPLLIIWLPFI